MNYKFNISSDDATELQIHQIQTLANELNKVIKSDSFLSDIQISEIYLNLIKSLAETMMNQDIYGIFLIYDLLDKVIFLGEEEEEFKVCYNMFELIKKFHKEYEYELSIFMEEV